ncbi:MAG: hypothetical protein Q7V20_18875, partial [Aquabacterium sp.]|uniref:hypothetical protein n=1 Tax=Aquabacterium sp. TaxID=1872578 RepID=UPI00271EB58D
PLAFVLVTVLTGSVMSIMQWWTLIDNTPNPKDAFQLKLMVVLGSIMIVLTCMIMADAVRKWVSILRQPPARPKREEPGREPVLETADR